MEMRRTGWKAVLRHKTLTPEGIHMSLTVAVDHKNPNMTPVHIAPAVTVAVQGKSTTERSPSKQRN